MKTKAAVAWKSGQPLTIETVDLQGPKFGEVLVEIKATGICHTDYYTLSGADPEGIFPAILGHEGAGIVVDVGPGVTTLKKGDHVIPLYTPECRQCKFCLSRKTNLCQLIRGTQGKGLMPDATSRFSLDGKPIFHYMGTSTFSNYTVAPEISLAKIREDAPFDKVCYIGCGVTTGIGAVLFTAKVEAGANVVVFGLGGIGLNVIQGAKMVGADKIIGVDINPARQEMARKFGMTHFINPKDTENVVDAIVQLTDGGADYSFECIGNTKVMRQALECTHKGWGRSIIIGVAEAGAEISTRPFQLVTGRKWEGSAFGGARGRTDVPKIVDWYMEGKINIDDLITHTMPLEDINKGFDLMKSGESIRGVNVLTSPHVRPLLSGMGNTPELELLSEHGCFGGVQRFYQHDSREVGLADALLGVPAAECRGRGQGAGADLPCRPHLQRRDLHDQGRRAAPGGRAGPGADRAGHQPARREDSGRNRQLGLRPGRRFYLDATQAPGHSTTAWKATSRRNCCRC
jgi:S-(hydroxymethyl)glutathione dehydrogenase/alcohol dehydrogenase